MPSEGMYQKPAGKMLSCGCERSCACSIPSSKTMRMTTKHFTIQAPEYKGNAVLNAQK
jgi:hypothetical protein